ncbi:ABC transporter ATP-binding protein [Corynebacterium sp. CCM 9185]|uniref:ABC transporter ATP-binding protein n=1 Tax=Corynebacterium marambiense TaxID=2765364 RepID=A0ABS0VVB9_9CORY|nr:ABC transporter ATP-binding protein [Corynebacterium marambiense]MBI9000705.1 ABC transporter ATP-binding protein [Corynebacterium marambiense]MCK7663032.1 ABC transporter ATP-binding protein [Corynebacterium marambiense]
MITVSSLTRRYGGTVAVDDLSLTVPDGQVTGFLGPNGAGKSTTMRMICGLERPDEGTALIDGHRFTTLPAPARVIGALLDASWFHPGRSGEAHLRMMARAGGIDVDRVDTVLDRVGLHSVAHKRVGGYSLGMRQRLGLACALLGDPSHIILDEPVNGLDPEGVIWMRRMTRQLAEEGRAVLVSSHLLSEMSVTTDRLVIIGQGRLIAEGPLSDFVGDAMYEIRCTDVDAAVRVLAEHGITADRAPDGLITVSADTTTAERIARLCQGAGIVITHLASREQSLEDVFLTATADTTTYRSSSS